MRWNVTKKTFDPPWAISFLVFLILDGILIGVLLGVFFVAPNLNKDEGAPIQQVIVKPSPQKTVGHDLVAAYEQRSTAYGRYADNATLCAKINSVSMAPAVFPGNTACYAPYDEAVGVNEGDIIIFLDDEGDRVMHAVIAKLPINDSFELVTKGYNRLTTDDAVVTEDRVVGVVTEVRFT